MKELQAIMLSALNDFHEDSYYFLTQYVESRCSTPYRESKSISLNGDELCLIENYIETQKERIIRIFETIENSSLLSE